MFMGYVTERILVQDQLTENPTNSKARSIYFNVDMIFWLKMVEYWSFGKGFL